MEITAQSVTVSWVFSVAYMLFCIYKPRAARFAVGIFYILMGLGVNLILVLTFPDAFVMIGGNSPLLPIYGTLFNKVVALAPAAWGLFIALFETTMGVMILTRGLTARLGLIGYTVFCFCIMPLNWMAFPACALAVGHIHILRTGSFEKGLPDVVRRAA